MVWTWGTMFTRVCCGAPELILWDEQRRGQGRVVTDASGHVVTCPFARSWGEGSSSHVVTCKNLQGRVVMEAACHVVTCE